VRTNVLAWSLFGLFIALVVASGVVTLLGPAPDEDLFFLAVVGFAFVGALVASRQSGNAIGWLLLVTGILLAFGALVDANLMLDDITSFCRVSAHLAAFTRADQSHQSR
jgi:hypothetical protein